MRASPVVAISTLIEGYPGLLFKGAFCAEHEWGIGGLIDSLGIDKTLLGIEARTTSKKIDPAIIQFGETPTFLWLWIDRPYKTEARTLELLKGLYEMGESSLGYQGGWDDSSIGIWVHKEKAPQAIVAELKAIVKAAKNKERLVITLGGGSNPFGGGGLVIAARSAIDKRPEINETYLKADLEAKALKEVWTPIETRLKLMMKTPKFNKYQQRYYAESQYHRNEKELSYCYLGPKTLEAKPVENSKYPFMLWLNPDVQDLYDSGWYTVEQIEQWINGEGPVIDNGRFPRLYKAQEEIAAGRPAYPSDYYALCPCGYIHHDGNASGRNEMLGLKKDNSWGGNRATIIKICPKCKAPAENMIFSTDDPEHWTNKKEKQSVG